MKAIIGITQWEQTRQELRALARQLDAGKRPPQADYHLNFASAAQLLSELPPKRIATLRALKSAGPCSIHALATRLGRNYSNVHADIARLLELGLALKNVQGRVFVPFDDVRIEVDASLMAAA